MQKNATSKSWLNPFAQDLHSDLLTHWRSEKIYSLEILEAMPSRYFSYRPTVGQNTFAEQLSHMALANTHYFSSFTKNVPDHIRDLLAGPNSLDKSTLREYVTATFDYAEYVLSDLSESDFLRRNIEMPFPAKLHTAQDVFLRAYRHTADHRGQLIVYLRLKGITPPTWRFSPNGKIYADHQM